MKFLKNQKSKCVPFILVLLTFEVIGQISANTACMVDQCRTCEDNTTNKCRVCESGYYLRTLMGAERGDTYNFCWSVFWLWVYIGLAVLAVLFTLLLFGLFYYLGL